MKKTPSMRIVVMKPNTQGGSYEITRKIRRPQKGF